MFFFSLKKWSQLIFGTTTASFISPCQPFCSLNRHKQSKFFSFFPSCLQRLLSNPAQLSGSIGNCSLFIVKSQLRGAGGYRGLALIHNWKWLLWSIYCAFSLLWGDFVFFLFFFSPLLNVILSSQSLSFSLMHFHSGNSHFSWDCSKFRFQTKCPLSSCSCLCASCSLLYCFSPSSS